MKRIKKIRKLVGITQKEIATHLNMDQANYCNIENGKYIPNNLDEIVLKLNSILMPILTKLIDKTKAELVELENLIHE